MNIQEIAKIANVSIATVSRVLNNKQNVSQKSKDKVLEALDSLGLSLNLLQSHANEEIATLIVFIPDEQNPFYAGVKLGIEQCAMQNNYHVFYTMTSRYKSIDDFDRLLKKIEISGIISLDPALDKDIVEHLAFKYPFVSCSYYEDLDVATVCSDERNATFMALDYLVKQGRKNFLFVNSSLVNCYAKNRENFVLDYFKGRAQDFKLSISYVTKISHNVAYPTIKNALSQNNDIDAIFAISDVFAIAALNAASDLKIKVPDSLSIVGFDDIPLSTIVKPSITTIRQPLFEIGFNSTQVLLDKIQKKTCKNIKLFFDADLIVRNSS